MQESVDIMPLLREYVTDGKAGETMKRITKIEEVSAPMQKIRVAAYARVSTDSNDQQLSLVTQKAHYESLIKGNPAWEYAGLYYDDGISGTKMETRPGLLKMLDDCEHGCIDYVIVKSISRLARNTTDCLEIVRRLLSLNIPVFFEKEDIDTGKMESELLLSIMGSIAESESVSISENNKWGVAYRFQNGTFKNSCVPYGYEWNAKESVMEIIPEQAEIVKYIFSRTLAGMGTAAIAKELSKRGVPTKRGGNWTGHTVKEIIRNEKYIGDCLFQKTYTDSQFNRHINNGERDQFYMEKHHEAIINKADYEAANALIDLRRDEKGILTGTTKYQNRYPLSGKVICGLCGSKMKRKTTENGVIFACFTHIEDKEVCKMKSVKQEDVEFAFATMMNKLIYASTKIIKPYLEDLKEINMTDELLRISDIDSRLEEIVEQKQTLRSLFAQQLLDPAVYKQENNILTAETERLNCQKDALSHRAKSEMTYIDETERLLRFTRHAPSFDGFDADAFEKYVEKIIVINRSTLEFHLKCGLNLQERTE